MYRNANGWGGNAVIGGLYLIADEADTCRVGHGPMYGRLKVGDVLLCVQHAGDCFYDYQLVEVALNGVRLYPLKFGAYQVGTLLDWAPSASELESMRSEFVATAKVWKAIDALEARLAAQRLAALCTLAPGDIVRVRGGAADGFCYAVVVENYIRPERAPGVVLLAKRSLRVGNDRREELLKLTHEQAVLQVEPLA